MYRRAKFKPWIEKHRDWTSDELGNYRTYAKYSGDKKEEVRAYQLTIENNDKDFLIDIYQRQLAELHIDLAEHDRAFKLLKGIIQKTDNNNIVRDCVEQLCRIVLSLNDTQSELKMKAFDLIRREHKKYKTFSPNVNDLIHNVNQSIGQIADRQTTWWNKLFSK